MKTLRNERGQQFVLVAALLPFLIAFLGLVVDVGKVFVHQRLVQNAADAAAAAAGAVLYSQGRTVAISTATYYATRNGYTTTYHHWWHHDHYNDDMTVHVGVYQPPESGAYAGNTRYIQVKIREEVTPIFASVVWDGTFTVRGTATAGYTIHALGADLYVLKDTACDGYVSLTMNGNQGKVRAVNGTVQVNSPCSNAVSTGNGDIEAAQNNFTGPSYAHQPNGIVSPLPRLNAPPIPDPLANLPTPSTTGCLTRTGPVNGKYLPGVYASGFSPNFSYPFDGSSGECDGVFYFRGSMGTNNKDIVLTHGMFYFESGSLTLGGNATMVGTAPTSGTYAGMLIFMGRSNYSEFYMHGTPQSNCSTAAATMRGIVYAPKGTLRVQGTSDQCYSGTLIAWIIAQNGNATTTLVAYPDTAPGFTVTDSQVE